MVAGLSWVYWSESLFMVKVQFIKTKLTLQHTYFGLLTPKYFLQKSVVFANFDMNTFALTSTTYLPHFDIDVVADDALTQYYHNPKYLLVVTDIATIFTVFSMKFQILQNTYHILIRYGGTRYTDTAPPQSKIRFTVNQCRFHRLNIPIRCCESN